MMNKVRAFIGKADVKWPLMVLVGGLWALGLWDQLGSFDLTAKYVGISVAMGALFLIT